MATVMIFDLLDVNFALCFMPIITFCQEKPEPIVPILRIQSPQYDKLILSLGWVSYGV